MKANMQTLHLIRSDAEKFADWQRAQNEGEPLRSIAPRQVAYEADDGYNAAQGSHFNRNGWGQ